MTESNTAPMLDEFAREFAMRAAMQRVLDALNFPAFTQAMIAVGDTLRRFVIQAAAALQPSPTNLRMMALVRSEQQRRLKRQIIREWPGRRRRRAR